MDCTSHWVCYRATDGLAALYIVIHICNRQEYININASIYLRKAIFLIFIAAVWLSHTLRRLEIFNYTALKILMSKH